MNKYDLIVHMPMNAPQTPAPTAVETHVLDPPLLTVQRTERGRSKGYRTHHYRTPRAEENKSTKAGNSKRALSAVTSGEGYSQTCSTPTPDVVLATLMVNIDKNLAFERTDKALDDILCQSAASPLDQTRLVWLWMTPRFILLCLPRFRVAFFTDGT